MQTERLRRFQGCLVGLAVGDALGMPVEGMPRYEVQQRYGVLREIVDGWLPAGSTTDDTAQALALAESLVQLGRFDADDFALKLLAWFRSHPPDGASIPVACWSLWTKAATGGRPRRQWRPSTRPIRPGMAPSCAAPPSPCAITAT